MSLPPALALRLATYVLAYDGLVALYLADLMPAAWVLALGLLVAASFRWTARPPRVRGFGTALVVVAAAASTLDLLYVAQSALDGFVRLLVFVLLYRLFTLRSLRDHRDAAFLAFFMLVAASPMSFGVAFLFVFLGFLAAGTWMLMLRHVLAESERVARAAPAIPGRTLLGLSLAATLATIAVTAGLFLVIPRIGQAALPLRLHLGRMVSGFAERVELGAFGEIESDASVVMRVHLDPATPAPERLPDLRWRGIAFERFDGRAWTAGDRRQTTLRRRAPAAPFELQRVSPRAPRLTQEIYLEPLGTDVVFGAPRMARLWARAPEVVVDDAGSVTVASAAARLHYTVESVPGAAPDDGGARDRYLQLPRVPPRVQALAREVTAGSAGPREAAARLTAFLSSEFRYTRALDRQTALDPVEEFLFVRRSGNCEYFAASLAVMLRTLGIPARVVNGFQRGEWNPYGGYFMVRLRDAHSWVEAYLDGVGWVTLDPSPRGAAETFAPPPAVSLYLDALRVRWYRYVVNWSLQDQVVAAGAVRRTASSWSAWRPSLPGAGVIPLALVVVAALSAVVAAVVVWRRSPAAAGAMARAPMPAFYARALRALARRGLRPAPGETAREFAQRVAGAIPTGAAPVLRLTAAYEGVRFGRAPVGASDAAELERCVAALRGGPRQAARFGV